MFEAESTSVYVMMKGRTKNEMNISRINTIAIGKHMTAAQIMAVDVTSLKYGGMVNDATQINTAIVAIRIIQ